MWSYDQRKEPNLPPIPLIINGVTLNTWHLHYHTSRTDLTLKNIGNTNILVIYSDSESAIQSVIGQNRESDNNMIIRKIRTKLKGLCSCVDEMKMIYCPPYKSIYETNPLDKVDAKKATHLVPRTDLTISELKNTNTQITIDK